MHKHHWLCSDIPGIYYCACKSEAYYNSLTGNITPYEDQTFVSPVCYNEYINPTKGNTMTEITHSVYTVEFTKVYSVKIDGDNGYDKNTQYLDNLSEQEIFAISDGEPELYRRNFQIDLWTKNEDTGEPELYDSLVFDN